MAADVNAGRHDRSPHNRSLRAEIEPVEIAVEKARPGATLLGFAGSCGVLDKLEPNGGG
jgi:hypothetical protein